MMRNVQQLHHYAVMLEALAADALRAGDIILHGAHTEAALVYSKLIGRATMGAILERLGPAR